jgi:DNA-binding SARP family transcriptional activator
MESSLSSNQGIPAVASEASSPAALLERGIQCIREGCFIEGVTYLALAREKLSADQMYFAAALDAFIQSHTSYRQAQQTLFMASKRFVETETEQQTQLLSLEKLMLTLKEDTNTASQPQAVAQPFIITHNDQAHQLHRSPFTCSDKEQSQLPPQSFSKDSKALPALYATCFGHFEIRRFDQVIAMCRNRSGQAILRYLIAQPDNSASADSLMGVFWAEDSPEVARRKLQIAVSAARQSLNSGYPCDPGGGYILCKNQFYQINSTVTIHTDVDEFLSLWKAGQQASASASQAITLYESACQLYTGPFFVEDMYADWSFTRREQLHQIYLAMCHALANYYIETSCYEVARKWTNTILKEDHCDEEAHRQLIRIYSAEGRRSEAMRQFQRCERVLVEELGVSPMPETIQLFQTLLTGKPPSNEKSENRAKIEPFIVSLTKR